MECKYKNDIAIIFESHLETFCPLVLTPKTCTLPAVSRVNPFPRRFPCLVRSLYIEMDSKDKAESSHAKLRLSLFAFFFTRPLGQTSESRLPFLRMYIETVTQVHR